MKRTVSFLISVLVVAGCQSLPPEQEGVTGNRVLVSASHCLKEYLDDLKKIHYGPCLKITSVDGESPDVREDGFIELPVATELVLGTTCVYRHADGTPIPATVETAEFPVTRGVIGCQPTLSRSVYPTYDTD